MATIVSSCSCFDVFVYVFVVTMAVVVVIVAVVTRVQSATIVGTNKITGTSKGGGRHM